MNVRSLFALLCAAMFAASCGSDPAETRDFDATPIDDTGGDGGDAEFDVADDVGEDTVEDAGTDPGVDTTPDTDPDVEPDIVIPPGCGNGVVDDGEECDDGDDNSNDTPDACRLDCTSPRCGDGVTDDGEACDDGAANSDTLADACRLDCSEPVCGDGVTDDGEACDDGNDDDTDGCGNACVIAGADLCEPCTDDAECGREADLCTTLGDASFCTFACGEGGACPAGTVCEDTGDAEQCVPVGGVCEGCLDDDGDGYGIGAECAGFDCDETRGDVFAGAAEFCDGVDNDCDGLIDEEATDAVPHYADGDEDGYGVDDDFVLSCAPVEGYPTADGGDCDDDDPAINPGAAEVCDGVDNDCSEDTADGVGDELAGFPCDGLDEDLCPSGTTTCVNLAIVCVEEAGDTLEICDGRDNDCDPSTPDGSEDEAVGAPCDGEDSDQCEEGVATCTDGALVCDDLTSDNLEICNGEDDDCDGFIDNDALDAQPWYADDDEDGAGADDSLVRLCNAPADGVWVNEGGDCAPGDPAVFPGQDETCNGIDDNCDDVVDTDAIDIEEGFIDEDGDGFGATGSGELFCDVPDDRVLEGGDCNDDPEDGGDAVNPGVVEVCDDGIDNDCNFAADCFDAACAASDACVDLDCISDDALSGVGEAIWTGSNTDQGDDIDAPCIGDQGSGGADVAALWTVPVTGQYQINTVGSDFDTVLYLLDSSCDGESLVCNDDAFGGSGAGPGGLLSQVTPPLEAGQQIIIVVDAYGGANGDFQVNIELDADEVCDNGEDDDLDGLSDCFDPECAASEFCAEDCTNGVDDNGNDLVDCADPTCATTVGCRPESCGDNSVGFVYGEGAIVGSRDADEWAATCAETDGNDDAVVWTAAGYDGLVTFTATSAEGAPVLLSALDACDGDVLSCGPADEDGLTFFFEDGDDIVLVVDAFEGGGDYAIDIAIEEQGDFCDNELDEDLDGLFDCEDPDCFGTEACIAAFCPLEELGGAVGLAVATGSTEGLPDIADGSCAGNDASDAALQWTAPADGLYEFNTLGSDYDTLLFLTDSCGGEEVACNDDGADYAGTGERLRSQIRREFTAGESVIINITGFAGNAGDYELNILPPELCFDGFDNDFDGAFDCDDSDCFAVEGCAEICDNGVDDNGNELTDCVDSQCADLPECQEICEGGVDEDDDGAIDCEDTDCFDAPACAEICDNGVDDGDADTDADCADTECIALPGCCEPDVFEPNTGNAGAPSTTDEVFFSTDFDALTLPTGDVDSFRFTTCPGAVVEANATFAHADGNVDLRLLNQFGQLLASGTTETDNESLTYTVETITVVFLQAYIEGDAAVCASYDLDVSVTGCDEAP